MSVQWYIASVLTSLSQALKPLVDALDSPEAFADFLARFGYESLVTDSQQIDPKFALVKQSYTALENAVEIVNELYGEDDPKLADIISAVQNLGSVATNAMKAIDDLKGMTDYALLPAPLDQESFWENFPPELVGYLLHHYIEGNQPKIFGLLTAFGILSVENVDAQSIPVLRKSYQRRKVYWERIGMIIGHPDRILSEVYGLGSAFDHSRLINNLTILGKGFGLPAAEIELSPELLTAYYGGNAQPALRQMITSLYWDAIEIDAGYGFTSIDLILAPIPAASIVGSAPVGFVFFPILQGQAGTGIEITPYLRAVLEGGFESAGPVRLEVYPEEIQVVVPPALGTDIHATASLEASAAKALILIGTEKSSRFEIKGVGIELSARGPLADLEYRVKLSVDAATLVVYLNEGDGFLQKVIPGEGLKVQLDFQLGWSSKTGFFFSSSANLEATIPVHIDLFGALKIDSIYLALRDKEANSQTAIELVLATSARLEIAGKIKAHVERIGLKAIMTFPPEGGNLGPANLAFGFKPPDGVGLKIDASVVVGGGYLTFDSEKEQYTGILYLSVKDKIALTAIGILTTRLPDGKKTFSLIIIITAEFPPIQLGYGFALTGVGGLLGVNRTMVLDVLRDGIKNKTIDSILFPKDPIANAPKIISDLQAIFPPAEGRFVLGPMAKIIWGGSYPILSIELGILIELPSPVRLALLGKITLALPKREKPEDKVIVYICMDIIGIIDFDKGEASVDGVLTDSRIALFPITGGMAFRLRWGSDPFFAVSIGGFNPRFAPPPGFPTLDRLAIQLSFEKDSFHAVLRLQTYLAVTANTFQFGARIDAYAKISEAIVAGFLGFDALVEFHPFYFIVDLYGGVAVQAFGIKFSVDLLLTLSGPQPFLGDGHVTVNFLGKHEFPIHFTIGDSDETPALPPVDPLQELKTALSDLRNWNATLPSGTSMLVTLRQLGVDEMQGKVLAHPLGELTVRQQVLPFGVPLERFGASVPTTPGPFEISQFHLGISPSPVLYSENLAVRDAFARGQFVNLSEDQKLSNPAFESFRCGQTRIGTEAIKKGIPQTASFEYDVTIIDKKEEKKSRTSKNPGDNLQASAISDETFLRAAQYGAAKQTLMQSTGSAKFAGTAQGIHVRAPQYVVASTEDLKGRGTELFDTCTEAEAACRTDAAGEWQVVEAHEVI